MSAVIARLDRLPHCGELHFSFDLNDLPAMSFRHYVTATAVSPDGCYIALGDHGGDVYIIHRCTPEAEGFSFNWTVHTGISYPSFLALSEDAQFLMVLDFDDHIHLYRRTINDWIEEWVFNCWLLGLRHYIHLYDIVFERHPMHIMCGKKVLHSFRERNLMLLMDKDNVLYSFRRRKWPFLKRYYWMR